jgi:hypothetical protein
MQAQRDCLNAAAGMITDVAGSVFDLGLGNGRTFGHLRETLPDREVFVFDRVVNANPKSTPDGEHLFLGEVVDQLAAQQARFTGAVALVHSDPGDRDRGGCAADGRPDPVVAPAACGRRGAGGEQSVPRGWLGRPALAGRRSCGALFRVPGRCVSRPGAKPCIVTPAQAGIHNHGRRPGHTSMSMDSRLRGSDE